MRQSGATFEEIVVPFHTEERGELIRKHSPSELVPVLTDGDLLINDSLAIAKYLAERHPTAGLWPEDAAARAAAAEMHSGFGALQSTLPMNFCFPREGPERSGAVNVDVQRIEDAWAHPWMAELGNAAATEPAVKNTTRFNLKLKRPHYRLRTIGSGYHIPPSPDRWRA